MDSGMPCFSACCYPSFRRCCTQRRRIPTRRFIHKPDSMFFDRKELTDEQLLNMYRSILLPRMVEEKMLVLLRQGKISKWFSGIGQEAISVGATLALQP